MNNPPDGLAHNPAWMYSEIMRRLEKCPDPKVEDRLTRHLHAKAGYKSIRAFNLGGSPRQQIEIYTQLLRALITKNYADLLAQPEDDKGCAVEVVVEDKTKKTTKIVNSDGGDGALSTLVTLLTTPGITAQVRVWVTITQPEPDPLSMRAVKEREAFEGSTA